MKFIKRLLVALFVLIALAVVALYITGNGYIVRGVWVTYLHGHETAYLSDYEHFDNRTIAKSPNPQPWNIAKDYNKTPGTKRLEDLHHQIGSVAFLVIKNDSILHESYYDGFGKDSHTNSFSMAKSIVTAALGKAIMQGKVGSPGTELEFAL